MEEFIMEVTHNIQNINLTASEVAFLWSTYIMDTKFKCMCGFTLKNMEDQDIRSIFELALNIENQHIKDIKETFDSIHHPIPYGFTEKDVNENAKKLFSDNYMLEFLGLYSAIGISNYGNSLPMIARKDVRDFLKQALYSAVELLDKITEVQIKKGIYIRPPYVPISEKVEFASKQSFLGSLIGDSRPLTCKSIAFIFNASKVNAIAEALFLGFSQAVNDERIRNFMSKCRNTITDHLESINSILEEEDLFAYKSLNHEVSSSQTNPFSDRFSLFCSLTTLSDILNCYSQEYISALRKDIFAKLTALSTEIVKLQKDGMDIMIDNGWFEEPPKNVDRKDLVLNH